MTFWCTKGLGAVPSNYLKMLFTEEAEQTEAKEEKAETEVSDEELLPVKSFIRKKPGRKPLSDNLQRREKIIDIPEDEKTALAGQI
jgi:hypothetical protein